MSLRSPWHSSSFYICIFHTFVLDVQGTQIPHACMIFCQTHPIHETFQVISALCVQARNKSLTVLDAGAALKTLSNTAVTIDPAVKAVAQAAAVNAFGLTPENVQLADGKCLYLSCLHPAAT